MLLMDFTSDFGCPGSHGSKVSVLNYLLLTVWKNIPMPAQILEQTDDEHYTSF